MLKAIALNREQPGGGMITRFALELPWFCVWFDMCDQEMAMWRGHDDLALMLHSELERAAFDAIRNQVLSSFKVETAEAMVSMVRNL